MVNHIPNLDELLVFCCKEELDQIDFRERGLSSLEQQEELNEWSWKKLDLSSKFASRLRAGGLSYKIVCVFFLCWEAFCEENK